MKINIGTTKGNIVRVEIKKRYNRIMLSDIKKIVMKEFGTLEGISIIGWVRSVNKKTT